MNIFKVLSFLISPLFLVACSSIPNDNADKGNNSESKTPSHQKQKAPQVDEVSKVSAAVISLLQRAQQQEETGNSAAAISSLERAIRIAPRYPETYYRLGEIHYKQGNYNRARSLAQKALSLGAYGELHKKSQQLVENASQ